MKKTSHVAALGAAILVVLALGASAVIAAGETGKVKSEVTLGAAGYQGKVKAADPSCLANRTVVLKQKGNGVLSRSVSKPNGNWKADLEALNENIKIPAKVYAEVKASSPPGPVATCLAATSRTVEIAGG
jgi:hypothetical protein